MHWAHIIADRVKPMMVMPANHSCPIVHWWAGAFPGRIGWLVGPTAMPKTKLRKWMPFALDNDAFGAWTNGTPWDEKAWREMLRCVRMTRLRPRWALVPDVVADKSATIAKWAEFAPVVREHGFLTAFALQDGMTPDDVPVDADVMFLGGTTEWKWFSLPMWAGLGRRLHVGRVNSLERLWTCERLGVESVDGTGWMRDTIESGKGADLAAWIEGRAARPQEFSLL